MVALTGVAGSDALAATAIASGLIVGAVMLVAVGIDAGRRRESHHRRAEPAGGLEGVVRQDDWAPARRIEVSDSSAQRRRSIQPFAAAASIIEYSPDTW